MEVSRTIHPFPRCPKPARESGKWAVENGILLPVRIPQQTENTTNNNTETITANSNYFNFNFCTKCIGSFEINLTPWCLRTYLTICAVIVGTNSVLHFPGFLMDCSYIIPLEDLMDFTNYMASSYHEKPTETFVKGILTGTCLS